MARVALVTGGTRGIGAAISIALKNAGFKVATNYGGNDSAANAFRNDTGIQVYKWNVCNFESCAEGIARVEADLGPIDVLVNNAGITRDATLHRMTKDQWREVISTDLDSIFNMCRNVIEGMRARNYGRIISIASINGQKGQIGQTNYSAAKAGVIGFTKALALENAAKGITVNVVCPGYINTDMMKDLRPEVLKGIIDTIPCGRLGSTDDIAGGVLYLAAEQAGFITGATLTINGAQYIAG
jgi:acetoacetyl-CoA reductase